MPLYPYTLPNIVLVENLLEQALSKGWSICPVDKAPNGGKTALVIRSRPLVIRSCPLVSHEGLSTCYQGFVL